MSEVLLISVYNTDAIGLKSIFYQIKPVLGADLLFFGEYSGLDTEEPTDKDYNLLLNHVKQTQPKIIGLSLLASSAPIGFDIIRRLKQVGDFFFVVGGSYAIAKPEECIKHADAVAINEVEENMVELCGGVLAKSNYTDIPNFWFNYRGAIIKNGLKLTDDLSLLEQPDFDDKGVNYIIKGEIQQGWKLPKNKYYQVSTGRGCPFHCSFCIWSKLHKTGLSKLNYLRKRDVSEIITEMKQVKSRFPDLKMFCIADDTFIKDNDGGWLEEFCRRYKNEINLPVWIQVNFKFITDDTLKIVKQIMVGDSRLNIGIQSGDEQFREEVYSKFISNDEITKKIKLIKKHNVAAKYDIILGNPLETDENLINGLSFLLTLRPIRLRIYHLTHCPNTELTDRLIKKGIIKSDSDYKEYWGQRVGTKKQLFSTIHDRYWFFVYSLVSLNYIPTFFIKILTWKLNLMLKRPLVSIFDSLLKVYSIRGVK